MRRHIEIVHMSSFGRYGKVVGKIRTVRLQKHHRSGWRDRIVEFKFLRWREVVRADSNVDDRLVGP